VLLAAGCRPPPETVPERQRRILASVVDEIEFLAQAGQVESDALELLWDQPDAYFASPPPVQPSMAALLRTPSAYRGAKLVFRGKLVAAEEVGGVIKGLVLLPDGGLAAFRARRPPQAESFHCPAPGEAVEVVGAFVKIWVALDGRGNEYVKIPLVASRIPIALKGPEAGKLAKLEPAKRKLLPVTELDAPPVASRPVIAVGRGGALRLDGVPARLDEIVEDLKLRAAGQKNPLGGTALVAVVVLSSDAPADSRDRMKKALPVGIVFRMAP
jgi:hypothetical protein